MVVIYANQAQDPHPLTKKHVAGNSTVTLDYKRTVCGGAEQRGVHNRSLKIMVRGPIKAHSSFTHLFIHSFILFQVHGAYIHSLYFP